ncbi:MAG TPA: hypothetical protein VFZ48_03990 [Candidatus Saccharimonadales bacterium]
MLVHFIGTRSKVESDLKYFEMINKIVYDQGHSFTLDWVSPLRELVKSGESDKIADDVDWKKLNEDNLQALAKADVVIAEATTRSFSTGYQVAMAVQQKKPVLILRRIPSAKGVLNSGLASDFLETRLYDENNLEVTVADFLRDNTIDTKDMRFNFFIDRAIYNYLRWASFKSGKTKAEVLRELVQREINKEDY